MDPFSQNDMLIVHELLMYELTKEDGRFRSDGVGIFAGEQLIYMAPPAQRVPQLMAKLLDWTQKSEAHSLIKSYVFHHELEFIHSSICGWKW